ncbi:MAG: DUF1566 domain-containing protein [Magnetococcales bacterium]|nr:DUF1566 domain-containing protein [Magnetococcales bacterium]
MRKSRPAGCMVALFCLSLTLSPAVAGPQTRFEAQGNGAITDHQTGLVVLQNANCFGPLPWKEALAATRQLAHGACGLTDDSQPGAWRLPTRGELLQLMAWKSTPDFSGAQPKNYWSSTPVDNAPDNAWLVLLSNGYVSYHLKTSAAHLWPVRSSHP